MRVEYIHEVSMVCENRYFLEAVRCSILDIDSTTANASFSTILQLLAVKHPERKDRGL